MDNKAIAKEINVDIEIGMYRDYPKLKNDLEGIAHRLVLSAYTKNDKMSMRDIRVLKENDYLNEY
jgi:hypothetical protein